MNSVQYLIPATVNETSVSVDLTEELRKTFNVSFIPSTLKKNMWTFVVTEMISFGGPAESQAFAVVPKDGTLATEVPFEFDVDGTLIKISAILFNDGTKSVLIEW